MKPINWKDLFENYKGLWVALEQGEKKVVSSGKDAKKVFDDAKNKGVGLPTLVKVPTKSLLYVG